MGRPFGVSMTRKVFVKTYGCQMNVYDSERMTTALARDGYVETATADDADLIVLNTCHIREKAAEKVYSELGRFKPLKARNPDLKIAVAGCVAQAEGAEIVRRQPMVDLVVGPQSYHNLPDMVAGRRPAVDTDMPEEDKFDHLPTDTRPRAMPTAFLTVQEGCDKFCAFCVVPYTRGAEVSRPAEQVLSEARGLVRRGVREITLLGQNVNAYHGDGPDGRAWSLARLIRALAEIEGLLRLRYTTSHPNDMTDDLIAAHADVPELMPYLHLPVQSGSDRVLKAMNRRHTAASYMELIDRVRAARPDIALSGDFITGFPGETDEDFAQTLALVEHTRYAQAYSFKYSQRPGTPASTDNQVPEPLKAERLARLQEVLVGQQIAFNQQQIGRILPVLLEKPGRMPGQMVGRSPYLQAVHLDAGAEAKGTIVQARIVGASQNALSGEPV